MTTQTTTSEETMPTTEARAVRKPVSIAHHTRVKHPRVRNLNPKEPLSDSAKTLALVAGSAGGYLGYALIFQHPNHQPWWMAFMLSPIILGSVPGIKHYFERLLFKSLKAMNLHKNKYFYGFTTVLSGMSGVLIFKFMYILASK